MAQEALRNIGKHALNARGVQVALVGDPEAATLVVRDNGAGFEIDAAIKKGGRMGLISMEERVRAVGGTLTIQSERNKGTAVQAVIPGVSTRSIRSGRTRKLTAALSASR